MGLQFGQPIVGAWREIKPEIGGEDYSIEIGFVDLDLDTLRQVIADYASCTFDNPEAIEIMKRNAEIIVGDWSRPDGSSENKGYDGDPTNPEHRAWLFKLPTVLVEISKAFNSIIHERVEHVQKARAAFDKEGTRVGNSKPSSDSCETAASQKKSKKKRKNSGSRFMKKRMETVI